MTKRIQILIVEDNPVDAELLVRELKRSGIDFDWQRVDTEADYVAKLNSGLHLILSDYELPDFNGLRALVLLKQQPALDIPFIFVSGIMGEEMAVAAMYSGATDYLLKDRIVRLGSAVERALQAVEERAERKRIEVQFIEAQKIEAVGKLAGGMAHEFNSILTAIIGQSELLLTDLPAGSALANSAREIRQAAERAATLTRQLLAYGRK
jgi:two-component system, cell cycle sensor histidine kinase and response regulator CckA